MLALYNNVNNNISPYIVNIRDYLRDYLIYNGISVAQSSYNIRTMMNTISTQLTEINGSINNLYNLFNQYYQLFQLYFSPNVDESKLSLLSAEQLQQAFSFMDFPYLSWANFWSSFNTMGVKELAIDIYKDINNLVNPTSEDNINDFNTALDVLKTDTFIGSFYTLSQETIPDIIDAFSGQSAVFVFQTGSGSNSFVSIPAQSITLDMSFYLPYKHYGDMVISGFMWLGYLWLLFKRAPAIINGDGMLIQSVSNIVDAQFDGEGV